MPATITTREVFPANSSQASLKREIDLRIKAGAIRSSIETGEGGEKILCTEWNVLGSND
jgi:hypothetical protein